MAQSARSIKPLNEPAAVEVRTDSAGMPREVRLADALPFSARRRRQQQKAPPRVSWHRVEAVDDMYKINELWWRGEEEEINRLYFDLRLDNSRRLTVYRDLTHDRWYRQAG